MPQPTVIHDTFVIERSFQAPPDRVFAALADPAAKRRWFVEGGQGHDAEEYELDFRVGGHERAQYRFKQGTPFPGVAFVAEGVHVDIVPGKRVVIAATMTVGGNRISAALVTFEILPNGGGADLILTHQGAFFEGSDGPRIREGGWKALVDRLAVDLARS